MQKPYQINDTLTNKVSLYHILLFLVFLPFDRFYSELVLISLTIHTLIHLRKEDFRQMHLPTFFLLCSVYLLTMLSTIYTANTTEAFSLWTRQLAIVLFPLILLLNPVDLKKYVHLILTVFTLAIMLTIIYLYVDAVRVLVYYDLPFSALLSSSFINHHFASPIGLHATYLSMYAATGLFYLLTLLLRPGTVGRKLLLLLGLAVLLAGLIQLGSRAVLISLLVICCVAFPAFYLEGKARIKFVLAASLVLIALFSSAYSIRDLRHRLFDDLAADLDMQKTGYTITDPRAERWALALELIARSPVIGYGSGDEVMLLREQYFENKLYNSYLFRLNAHNQYLSFLIKSGIMGLLVFLATLFLSARLAVRSGNMVFLGFLVMIAIVSISENLLDVNKGIFFYAFFLSFFTVMEKNKKRRPDPAGQPR